jgi:outer membrane receptor protein involved in Fe transport
MPLFGLNFLRAGLLAGAAMAVLGTPSAFGQTATDASSGKSASGIEEVIVTAEKRPEAVRKISGSVSAVTNAQLEALGAQDMSDYLTRTPGVVFNAQTPGNSTVVLRGISTTTGIDQGQGTTGYFIDDVPLTDPSYSIATPDIDTFDVDHIVVLRGPQGTLFGSSSLGGAVNYQAAKPDLDDFGMHLQGSIESTAHGDVGGSGKVMVNVPIVTDTFAVRGVYVYRDIAGFIDNAGTGQKDANRTLIRGGRIEATWKPGPNTTINYLFLDQTEDTRDLGYAEPMLAGKYAKTTLVPETANFGTKIHNLRLDQDFGFATLTATATYHEKTQDTLQDNTAVFGGVFPGASLVTIGQPAKSTGQTYEVRLASPSGDRFEYVVGLYYDNTKEKIKNIGAGTGITTSIETVYGPLFGAGIGALSAPNDVWLYADVPGEGREEAAFGEFTYHFSDEWKATLGGRLFNERVKSETKASGFYILATGGAGLTSDTFGKQKASGFNPKGSITWTPSDDFMAYGLVSKGYRFGGPNVTPSTPTDPVPASYGSDSLINYEVGVRSNLLGDRLQLDATAFYIDWSNIQIHLLTSTNLNYATNGGKARSYGLETAATYFATDNLTLSTNVTYLNAALVDDFNPGGGQPIVPGGSTLPGASKWQVSDTIAYQWPDDGWHPSIMLSHRYISKAPGTFLTGIPQGGYNLFDARVGVEFGDYSVTAFVSNIGDVRGVTGGQTGPLEQYLVRPRTIGLTFDYKM